MIDTHAHLYSEFYDNIADIVAQLKEKDIINVINCGDSIKSSLEILRLSNEFKGYLLPAVGIHPDNIDIDYNKINDLEILIKNSRIVGIGEIGLDYYHNKDNKAEQIKLFSQQVDLAEKYNLPIIVHTRDSIQDCFNILKSKNSRGIIHCFSGSLEMAREFIKLGYYLGIGGVLTFKNSKLYKVIEQIDLSHIVLETDSPFLSPEPLRGTKNNPSNVIFVAKKIAEIKHLSTDVVIKNTTSNARKIFDI